MSFQTNIASDVQNLAVGNIVTLYELDLEAIGSATILYFTHSINNDYTPVFFNAREYTPIHMQTSGWQVTGTETLPRPKMVVSNVLLTFASYINTFDDLVGARLTRRRTLEKYLDGKPEANPNAEFAPDIYKIRSLPQKTKMMAEFELTPYMDYEGIKVPKRQILRDYCRQTYRKYNTDTSAFDYTKSTCPYTSIYKYTRLGIYTTDNLQDSCGKELGDCEMRYCGVKALVSLGTTYIQSTDPGGIDGDYWLNTSSSPNAWYIKTDSEWVSAKPDPLPTWSFPSVSRFRI